MHECGVGVVDQQFELLTVETVIECRDRCGSTVGSVALDVADLVADPDLIPLDRVAVFVVRLSNMPRISPKFSFISARSVERSRALFPPGVARCRGGAGGPFFLGGDAIGQFADRLPNGVVIGHEPASLPVGRIERTALRV